MNKYNSWLFIIFFALVGTIIAQDSPSDNWVESYYAPYVYMPRYPFYQLAPTAEETGVRYFTLAFMLGTTQCEARWTGTVPIDRSYIYDFLIPDLEALRELGGDVIVSFGGALGNDLAAVCPDVESLVEQYQRVIDIYGVTHLDFDIEGDDIHDQESLNRRLEAIAYLQTDDSNIVISFTLPVRPTGLTDSGITVLEAAIEHGVDIAVVNIMAMNYGSDFPPEEMGNNTIQATESLFAQLQTLFPDRDDSEIWQMVGITPMVGMNDRGGEIFEVQDAEQVTAFAIEHDVRLLSAWSLNRDQPCEYVDTLTYDCSGTEQDPLSFSHIFNQITE